MKRYEERRVGVFDIEKGQVVLPHDPGWRDYEAWLRAGNELEPEPASVLPPLSTRRLEAAARVNEVRSRALSQSTVALAGYTFSADTVSYVNLLGVGLLLAVGESLPPGFTWRTVDNQLINLTSEQVQILLREMVRERERIYLRSWQLKDEIIATSNVPESVNLEGDLG